MNTGEARGSLLGRGLAGLAEMAFDAVVAFDSRERITYWNPAAEQMYGWTAQEALGKTPARLFWSVSTSQEQKSRKQRLSRLKRGEILQGEQEACRKDGSPLYVQYAVRAVFDSHGKRSGYLSTHRNISVQKQGMSKRKRAKEQLEQSNQKLNEILTSIQDDFYVLDPDWNFVYVNRLFTSKIGKEPEEIIGHNIWKLFPKYMGTVLEENLHAAMEKREARRFEMSGVYTGLWYRMRAFPSEEGITVLGTDITERRQAEDALRASAQRLRQMIETSPVAIGFGDSTGKIFEANMSFYRLTGYSREEIQARQLGWNQLTAPEYAEIDRQIMATLDATGSAGPYEKEYIRKDGSRIPLLLTVSKLPGRDEHIAFIMDMTERKRAEEAIRESQRKYQDLIETTSDFIWETDNQGRYTYCSPQMEKLWGIKPEDMIGKTPFDVMPPKDREGALEYFAEVIRSAAPFSGLTTTALNSQGDLFYVETSGVPFFDHTGKLLGFRGITRDVSERNRTRRQVFESNQRLMALMNALPVGVSFSDDPTCQHITGNPVALAQFEVRSEDNLSASAPDNSTPGRQVQYFRDGKQITAADLPLQRAVAENREIPPMEFEVHLPSGRRWWASGSGAPIRDQNGDVIGGVAVTQDITVRKQAEDALREHQEQLQLLNETLEQKVQEKTAEVHHLASDLVKTVQRERHRLSHVLHDDLQQRIYAIRMQLALLNDDLAGEKETVQKEVSDIEGQLAEMLEVTRNLSIDLSPPILRDEGLSHAINWLAAQMRQRYGLPIELQADGPFAISNEELHVLLFNCIRELLFNVVKHAQASRAVVTLQWLDEGIQIEVRDDGKGFPVDLPAQRADGEMREDNDPQSNSGLPTIRHQLSLFGGQMEIQSEAGAGTRITLRVPVAEG